MTNPAPPQRHLRPGPAEFLGQPSPVDFTPRAVTELDESPIFNQLLREQAGAFRSGQVGVDNFGDFMEIANLVSRVDYGDKEEYAGPDGQVLTGTAVDDAVLLSAASAPDFWILEGTASPDQQARRPNVADEGKYQGRHKGPNHDQPLTYEQLAVVARKFEGYGDTANDELQDSEEALRQLEIARQRTASTLGIAEPGNLTLQELREAIRRRQELSDTIVSDRAFREQHFLPVVLRRYNATEGIAEQEGETPPPEPTPAPDPAQTTVIISRPMPAPAPSSGAAVSGDPQVVTSSSRHIRSHRRDPRTDPERASRRRRILATIATVALSVTVTTAIRATDIVPGGSIVVGTVTGAVGMTIATIANRRFWTEKHGWQKLRALAGAAGGGALLGAGVALGIQALSAGGELLHGLIFDDDGASLSQAPVATPDPSVPTDPTPPDQPPTPAAFDGPLQTERLNDFTGLDGADGNPLLEGTGCDAIADRVEAEYQLLTGQPIDWSAIDPHAFNNFVGEILEQNGKTWAEMATAPGDTTLIVDPQKALDFLASQSLSMQPSLAGAGV